MSSQVFWYAARASGIVAWALAAAAVVWGLALSTRVPVRRPRRPWLFDLHRFLGGLALSFTGVHVLSVVADSYVHFSPVNVLVPLTGGWHPLAVAWGIVGLYLLLAVELTSLARARLPRLLWRRVHYAGFALSATTTVHALSAGTDRRSPGRPGSRPPAPDDAATARLLLCMPRPPWRDCPAARRSAIPKGWNDAAAARPGWPLPSSAADRGRRHG
jgi:hypothetical protein